MSTEPMTYPERKAVVLRVLRALPDSKPGNAAKAKAAAATALAAIKAELPAEHHHEIPQILSDLNQ